MKPISQDDVIDPFDGMRKGIDPKLEYHIHDEILEIIDDMEVDDQ